MKAVLNYCDSCKSKNVFVGEGDTVMSHVSDFGLTRGMRYKIEEVMSSSEISIRNDLGVIEEYTVEHFVEAR